VDSVVPVLKGGRPHLSAYGMRDVPADGRVVASRAEDLPDRVDAEVALSLRTGGDGLEVSL
jgi:hypothetical protein